MAGQIKQMIERIVQQRSKGDPLLERTTRTKLLLKGINPNRFTEQSEDDELILQKLKKLAEEIGFQL